jgi:hypothetical protein
VPRKLSSGLRIAFPIKNLAAFPLEFFSDESTGERIRSECFPRNLSESQLGILKGKIIELAHDLKLGRSESCGFAILWHGESVSLARTV